MNLLEFLRSRAPYYSCMNCGDSMEGCHLRVLGRAGQTTLVQATCRHCNHTVLLQIQLSGSSISADLPLEQPPDPSADPITDDEMIDLHQQLAADSNLSDLFSRR